MGLEYQATTQEYAEDRPDDSGDDAGNDQGFPQFIISFGDVDQTQNNPDKRNDDGNSIHPTTVTAAIAARLTDPIVINT